MVDLHEEAARTRIGTVPIREGEGVASDVRGPDAAIILL
jgi:hypothetical protein